MPIKVLHMPLHIFSTFFILHFSYMLHTFSYIFIHFHTFSYIFHTFFILHMDGGANFLNANQGSAHASAHLFLIHFSYSFVIRSFVFSMSFSICFIPSAHKERSLHSFMAYGKSLCSWIIEKEEEGGRRQCDQIGRFIGLWATFRAFGNN